MITISATVVDNTTGVGIPGATISLNGQPVTATDEEGYFEVNVNTLNDTVTASSVGYAAVGNTAGTIDQAGIMRLPTSSETLPAAMVTAAKKNYWPWLILGGIVVAGSSRKKARTVAGKASNLVPIALVGAGAYLLLNRHTSPVPAPSTPAAPYTPPTTPGAASNPLLSPGNIASVASLLKGLFGGSTSPSTDPGVSSPSDTSYDPGTYPSSIDTGMAGIGATTTLNAGDIIGKTLVAAEKVPVYDTPRDDAQPSGYINKGNPIGIVYSYLNPDSTQGRNELWWMFEPLPGNSDIGDNLGYYYIPHNPDYFDTQALLDAGVLTVAQATALKQQAEGTSSILDSYIKKYGPWVVGIILGGVVIKSVINKTL